MQIAGTVNEGLQEHIVGEPGLRVEFDGRRGLLGSSAQMDCCCCSAHAMQYGRAKAPLSDFMHFTCGADGISMMRWSTVFAQ